VPGLIPWRSRWNFWSPESDNWQSLGSPGPAKTPVAVWLANSRGYPPGAAPDLAHTRSGASARAELQGSFWERPDTLDSLAPSINYSSCRDVAQLYSVRRHSGDMARIRDTAPVNCRGFVIFEVRRHSLSSNFRGHTYGI